MRRAWLSPLAAALLAAGAEARLTLEQLRSAEYRSELSASGRVTLRDGAYHESGAGGRFSVTLSEPIAFGDLDGDGDEDAVVTLISEAEGIGTFRDLAVVLNEPAGPRNAAVKPIPDRWGPVTLAIGAGEVVVQPAATHAPPARYRLKGSSLAEVR